MAWWSVVSSSWQDLHYVINMGNSIIGVSILAMPWCFGEAGIVLGTVLLVLGAMLTKVSCNLMLQSQRNRNNNNDFSPRTTFQFLAYDAFGKWAKLLVELATIGYLLGVCVAFLVVMGDLLTHVAARVLNLPETEQLRTGLLLIVTLCVALPLSLLEKIESLIGLSAFSIAFYVILAVKVSMEAVMSDWRSSCSVQLWRPEHFWLVLPIFATGLSCQTQVFVMYESLVDASPKRMNAIISDAINICFVLYWSVGVFGYMAFCEHVNGDILLNLESSLLTDVVKGLYVLTAAVSFPLCIFPCRRSVDTLFFQPGSLQGSLGQVGVVLTSKLRFRCITVVLVVVTLLASIVVPNIETILNLSGSTMGALVCFIVPAAIAWRINHLSPLSEQVAALVIFALGVVMVVACVYEVLFLRHTTTDSSTTSDS